MSDSDTTAEAASPKCLYRIEYIDSDDNILHKDESDKPLSLKHAPVKPLHRSETPVMEVVTKVSVPKASRGSSLLDWKPTEGVGKVRGTVIKIYSPMLINTLRAIVEYYPGKSLAEHTLSFEEPFNLLVHHRRALKEYRGKHPDAHDEAYRKECNAHIDVLLGFLDNFFQGGLALEEERHTRDPPVCTFEYLWLLLKPGEDIYILWNDYILANVIHTVGGGVKPDECTAYNIASWGIKYNGTRLGRSKYDRLILPFTGERPIASLPVFPASYYREADGGSPGTFREMMIARGKRFYDFTSVTFSHYAGYNLSTPRRYYEGRIVIDTDSSPVEKPDIESLIDDNTIGIAGCTCELCCLHKNLHGKVMFADYDRIDPKAKKPGGRLTDHQYMLCPREISGFVLKVRSWQILDIDYISDIEFKKDAMDDLVVDPETKDVIKSLASIYTRPENFEGPGMNSALPWAADVIKGKGDGQIILLHGPPGVGKTLTAETVAEFLGRPLLSLTCGDIGIESSHAESNLIKWTKQARRWGAILLIDEADIYLEARTPNDLTRNSLVSGRMLPLPKYQSLLRTKLVFLRSLEYYQGILFLTTNRVGLFDEAFYSRIHVSLFYPSFDDATRFAVWMNNLKKLNNERPDIKTSWDLEDYLRESKELKELQWNGREIRNAFQSAVALAEHTSAGSKNPQIVLGIAQIRQVVRMSRNFKKYIKSVSGDASKNAQLLGTRNDAFSK
ncbi:hypothetical protein FGG08_003088 [Glutinoglossum americanum]|uniref:AAA+ ATPase domain-containing protein n=1 Tax=Glutinoglossum americanum TaxID=1670608 RepID=A0A9P8L514_9PEZI|nr:hypothetical protein FGG08_003088 [Glutinoglossum americanum]